MNWDLLDDTQTHSDAENLARKTQRASNCGRPGKRIDPISGMYKSVHFYCGLHTHCQRCLNHRAGKLKREFYGALENEQSINVYTLSVSEADLLTKQLSKLEYIRYPGAQEDIVAVHPDAAQQWELIGGVVINADNVEYFKWLEAANTPEGRKISGNLNGIRKSPASKGTSIRTFTLVSSAPEHVQHDALRQSIVDTDHLNPQTPDELQEAIYERISRATNLILEEGYAATLHMSFISLSANAKPDWSKYTHAFREARDPYYLENEYENEFPERIVVEATPEQWERLG